MALKPLPQGPIPNWCRDFVNSYEPNGMKNEHQRVFDLFLMIHNLLMERDVLKDESALAALSYSSPSDYYQCILPKLIPRVEMFLDYLKQLAKEHGAWER